MKTKTVRVHNFFQLPDWGRFSRGQSRLPGWLSSLKTSFGACCLLVALTSMKVFAQTPAKPFGSNSKYDYGTMQTLQTPSQASDLSKSWYTYWASSFIKDCGGGKAIVVNDYNGSNAYSEGQGYGMLLAAYYGDKTTFDKLVQGYWSNRNSHGLMNWTVSCSNPNVSPNGATDGDLDAAMALLIANKQWPNTTSPNNYASLATTLITNIKNYEFVTCSNGVIVQKAGDWLGGCNCTNPSYYATGYYRAFAMHVPSDASFWNKAADDGLNLLLKATHPTTGLNPAWTDESGSITSGGTGDCNNIAAPGGGSRNDYQFDAARTPWRIVIDYLWWGTPKAKQYLDKITSWANGKGINNIMAGHHLDGTAYLTYTNSAFVGAFAVGAMGTTNGTVVNNFYKYWTDNSMADQNWASGKKLDDKPYFQNSLRTVYHFVASGNFWNPYASGSVQNQAPTVSISGPANNASFTAPASITISANASDADGSVSKVEFYNGSTLLGTATSSPYTFTWSNATAGTYSITAKATDNAGASTTSSAITVNVTAPQNQLPTVSVTAPASGTSYTAPATITITANASDPDGSISKVDFYNGTTLLGSDNSAPYSFTWTNVAASSNGYSITAKATDNSGAVATSAAVQISVNAPQNQPPTVSVTAPVSGASYTAPATITITASASDPDGSISKVDFYNGSTLLGSSSSAPYTFTWSNAGTGSYNITAKATDNSGAVTTSAQVLVSVNTPQNQLPTVTITAPASGTSLTAPATVTITANASDPDGSISKVDFYNGSTLLGSDNTAPYSFTWTNVAASATGYSITAKATDNSGAVATSAAVQISVTTPSNQLPTVSVTAPASGTSYTAPATVTITASASDPDGTISNVEFYNGTTLLGSDNTAPYSFTWSNVAASANGYSITARATDNAGATVTSAAVSIIVNAAQNQAPTVSITSPSGGASFNAPASITITANASDADGSVSSVQFFNGSTLLGTDNTAPYSFTWSNVAAGPYTITAKATDNSGAVTTSAPVSVTVNTVTPTGTTIQAETACSVDGTLNETANAGFHGTGYVNTDNFVNASATWAVNSENAQTVTLGIRYATATTPGRPMSLSVNGTTQIANIAFDNTGGATTWVVTNVQVNLVSGANTLKLVSTTDAGSPYIDELTFNTTSVTAGTCTTTPTNTPPTVSITAPAAGASFTAPASVNITANAADADGTVAKVEFYNGTTLLGSDNTAPYSFTWTNVAVGNYSITAKATDNQGASTTSAAVSVTVTGVTTGSTTFQAETACSVDGTLNETANAGFHGTGYVNTDDATNKSATWVFNSEGAQTVTLGIRYATITTPGRPMSLSVNGTTQVANIAFDNTGSKTNWTVTTVQVNLADGANTIKMVALSDAGSPYIDELTFGSSTVSAGTCPTSGTGGGDCGVKAVPSASDWVVRNDWADQYNNSRVSNTSDALQISHRAWGKNQLWVIQSTAINVISGQTYTIQFDFKNDGAYPVSSIDVGFGSSIEWNGLTLVQPTVTAPSGYPSSSYTTKTVTITANTTGTVYVGLRLNWPNQPPQAVTTYLKNVGACGSATADAPLAAPAAVNYEAIPNPFEGNNNAMIMIKDQQTVPVTITITDISGLVVYTSSSNYTNQGIYVGSNFKSGTYVVKAVYGQNVTTFRLIKN